MSHSAEKCKRGTLWDLLTYIQSQNIKKSRRDPLVTLKDFRKKVTQCRKKNPKGGPFRHVRCFTFPCLVLPYFVVVGLGGINC